LSSLWSLGGPLPSGGGPAVSLLELSFPTYPADAVPESLAKIPIEKPGS
jgi:hypothetical protein